MGKRSSASDSAIRINLWQKCWPVRGRKKLRNIVQNEENQSREFYEKFQNYPLKAFPSVWPPQRKFISVNWFCARIFRQSP